MTKFLNYYHLAEKLIHLYILLIYYVSIILFFLLGQWAVALFGGLEEQVI